MVNYLQSLVRVLFVIAVVPSVALRQYLVLQGAKLNSRVALVVAATPAQAAQDLLEGAPHVFVPEGVDDGVDEGVALGQHQEVLLVEQHLALFTAQTVEQEHDEAGRPADHKTACQGRIEREEGDQGYIRLLEDL